MMMTVMLLWWCITLGVGWHASADIQELKRTHIDNDEDGDWNFVGVTELEPPSRFSVPAFPGFLINVNTSLLTRNLAHVECLVSTLMGDTDSNLLRHWFSLSLVFSVHLHNVRLCQKKIPTFPLDSPRLVTPSLDHPIKTPKTRHKRRQHVCGVYNTRRCIVWHSQLWVFEL